MKILIVNMGSIYPLRAMNQVRTHNMMRSLLLHHEVDLATPSNSQEEKNASENNMSGLGGKYIDLGSVKPKGNLLKKRKSQLIEKLNYYLFATDPEVTHNLNFFKKLLPLAKNYDAVISNYWEGSLFFKDINGSVLKILDPHYSVAENFDVLRNTQLSFISRLLIRRKLYKNLELEKIVLNYSDAALPLSKRGFDEFKKIAPSIPLLLVPDGNDLDYFSNYPINPDPNTILFYGSMSSLQNERAFFRFYNNIYPGIKSKVPNVKILVVGANPSNKILDLQNNKNIFVTGFVEDVRQWISKAWFKIIPLEHGSGFRGRVVELMAMGIPVIGTHNALDSLELNECLKGLISDSDEDLANLSLKFLREHDFRNALSKEVIKFVKMNYSLETTFGRINSFIKELM